MPEEILLKTHLIVKDVQDKYHIKWCGKIKDANPLIKNGLPIFIVASTKGRVELNTIDMSQIESCAKRLTQPRGREAVTTDKAFIYIKEVNGNEKIMGSLTHDHIKTYAPVYDKVGYR